MLTYKYNLENAVDLTPLTEDKFLKRNGATLYEWVYDNELKRDVFHIYRTATEGAVFRAVAFKIPYDRFPQQNKNLAIVYKYKTSGTFGTGSGAGAWVTFEGRNLWEGVGINSSAYVKNLYVASSDNWNIGITKIAKNNPEYTNYSNSYKSVSVSLGSNAQNQDIYISDIMVLEITDEEYNDNNYKPTTFIPFTLPIEYQQVEYIESTGTQFIDTGIYPDSNIQIETNIEVTTTSQDTSIFGCFQDTGGNSLGSWYHLTPYNSKWYFGGNGRESNGGTYNPVVGTKYDIVFNNSNGYISINNNVITTDVSFVGYSGSTLTISRRGQINNPRYGKYKYFKFKVFDKNTNKYIADYVPCYRKNDGVIGMFDIVNNIFYTNSGTGTFNKGKNIYHKIKSIKSFKNNLLKNVKYIKTKVNNSMVKIYDELPSEYQRVEYISSNNTNAYIDTGLVLGDNFEINLKYSLNSYVTAEQAIISTWSSTFNYWNLYVRPSNAGANPNYLDLYVRAQKYANNESIVLNRKYDVKIKRNGDNWVFAIDNDEITFSNTTLNENTNNLVVFTRGDKNGKADDNVYKLEVYKNNVLVRNFVPCYRKIDNVIGLYDLVNDVFYTNAGSDTFSKGSDI